MAVNRDNTLVGAPVVSIGDYVAAAGAGTLVDIGHGRGVTLTPVRSKYDLMSDRSRGPIRVIPVDSEYTLKFQALEMTAENLRLFLEQASGNKTGTPPNLTLLVGHPPEVYRQIQLVGVGLGTTLVRTVTLWRCVLASIGDIAHVKGTEQVLDVTYRVLNDDTVTTNDKAYKIVDS